MKSSSKRPRHGGKRPGAGRPAVNQEAATFIPYPERLPAHLKAYWDKRGIYFQLYLADSPEYGTYEDFLEDLTDCYDHDPKAGA
jgi:hypothetical protein